MELFLLSPELEPMDEPIVACEPTRAGALGCDLIILLRLISNSGFNLRLGDGGPLIIESPLNLFADPWLADDPVASIPTSYKDRELGDLCGDPCGSWPSCCGGMLLGRGRTPISGRGEIQSLVDFLGRGG